MEETPLPNVHLQDFEPIAQDVLMIFPEGLVKKNLIVPIAKREGRLVAAVPGTSGLVKPAGLKLLAGCPVDLVLAPLEEIIAFIKMHYPGSTETVDVSEAAAPLPTPAPVPKPVPVVPPAPASVLPPPVVKQAPEPQPQYEPQPEPEPVIEMTTPVPRAPEILSEGGPIERLVSEGVKNGASEVIIDLKGQNLRVRHRIRGVVVPPPAGVRWSVEDAQVLFDTLRQKGSGLNREGVRYVEWHGRVQLPEGLFEALVHLSETSSFSLLTVRLNPRKEKLLTPTDWGMDAIQARALETILSRQQGVVLFCGAEDDDFNGSAHAALRRLATPQKHAMSVEMFISEWMKDVDQLEARGDRLLFNNYLETALSHNPDVLLVDPLDRKESYERVFQECLRGPLILGATYARDAAEAISGILRMGIDSYLVGSGLLAVVVQRKLKLNCPHCQEKEHVSREQAKEVGIPVELQPPAFFHGVGCERCLKSGSDRQCDIFELMIINDEIRSALQKDATAERIRSAAKASGMLTLRQIAIHKAVSGQTSVSEVVRATLK